MTKIEQYLEEHQAELKPWLEDGAQGRIEIKILPHLKGIENGFFIEAGALDGLFMSNTKLLEDLGWNGLLIEPQKKAVARCRQNRKAPAVWGALVPIDFKDAFITGDFFFDGEGGEGAWSSVSRNTYGFRVSKSVPAYTLFHLLNAFNIPVVDFFSLDVEGFEFQVLRGIDFKSVDFRNILIEVNSGDYDPNQLFEFMKANGFKEPINLSNFTKENSPDWEGTHQDYLFTK